MSYFVESPHSRLRTMNEDPQVNFGNQINHKHSMANKNCFSKEMVQQLPKKSNIYTARNCFGNVMDFHERQISVEAENDLNHRGMMSCIERAREEEVEILKFRVKAKELFLAKNPWNRKQESYQEYDKRLDDFIQRSADKYTQELWKQRNKLQVRCDGSNVFADHHAYISQERVNICPCRRVAFQILQTYHEVWSQKLKSMKIKKHLLVSSFDKDLREYLQQAQEIFFFAHPHLIYQGDLEVFTAKLNDFLSISMPKYLENRSHFFEEFTLEEENSGKYSRNPLDVHQRNRQRSKQFASGKSAQSIPRDSQTNSYRFISVSPDSKSSSKNSKYGDKPRLSSTPCVSNQHVYSNFEYQHHHQQQELRLSSKRSLEDCECALDADAYDNHDFFSLTISPLSFLGDEDLLNDVL